MSVHWTAGYAAASPWPMTHARILHTPLTGTVAADSSVEGFAAANAANPNTYSFWKPAVTPVGWSVTFAAPQTVDAVGIGAAQIAGRGVTVATFASGVWTNRISFTQSGVAGDSAALALFAPVVAEAVGLFFGGIVPVVGVIYAGRAMVMPRAEFTGMGQLTYSRRTEFEQNISEGGQWLGRSVARIATQGQFAWEYLGEDFVRDELDPFSRAAQVRPFFLAPMPSRVAADCHLAWVREDIRPQRMGVKGFQRVAFDAIGHVGGT